MRKEKREEEQKILAQMDEAMKENKQPEPQKKVGIFKDKTPNSIHCRKCNTLMENGKCPTCGHTVYVPMDDKKQATIRWVLGGICLVVFVIVFLVTR